MIKVYTDFTVEEMLDKKTNWKLEEVEKFLDDVKNYCLDNYSNLNDTIEVFKNYYDEANELSFDVNAVIWLNEKYYYSVYSMDCFNDIFNGCEPLELARNLDSDFNVFDDWFQIEDCGRIVSSSDLSDLIDEYDDFIHTINLICDISSNIIEELEKWLEVEKTEMLREEAGELMFR